jgi:CheY-like chemotaxis protein
MGIASSIVGEAVTVFVVDDDAIDREMVSRSIKDRGLKNPLRFAHHGEEALDILRGQNGQERLRAPYLILLDLNMPRMNGIELLTEIRADPALCRSIVVVLTTSNAERDRFAAYDRHVAGYVLKARAGLEFEHGASLVDHFTRVVEFPN